MLFIPYTKSQQVQHIQTWKGYKLFLKLAFIHRLDLLFVTVCTVYIFVNSVYITTYVEIKCFKSANHECDPETKYFLECVKVV